MALARIAVRISPVPMGLPLAGVVASVLRLRYIDGTALGQKP
jgi:hypothetical protein